jgi:hypothetical protein
MRRLLVAGLLGVFVLGAAAGCGSDTAATPAKVDVPKRGPSSSGGEGKRSTAD